MSFDTPIAPPRSIAIVGGGIAGLAAAYLLAPANRVTLFEAAPRLGGHARTVIAGRRGDQPVDTGFIVFNYANYPHLTRLFADLDVPVAKSDMSFGVSLDNGRLEYALRDLSSLFAQRRNLVNPAFLGMLRDLLRFNAQAEAAALDDTMTVDDLTRALGLGEAFRRDYLLPICGAIWSTPSSEIGGFPAKSLLRFFRNHALLSPRGQHQWWTVQGGSVEYVRRLEARLSLLGVDLRRGCPVRTVTRDAAGALVRPERGLPERFDAVILACHSDQALALLADASARERADLSAVAYRPNRAVLHADPGQMPNRRACWSSWVYRAEQVGQERTVGVTYWMNRLQSIPDDDPLFVTLNPQTPVREDLIHDEVVFDHPVFDRAAMAAQQRIAARNGDNHTWFAGAWLRHGFHEDGFASAVRVARALGSMPATLTVPA
ncbi:MAG: FAD-dependent oxidoreductase [Rhodobacter sp.]|uniref:NAD(P)/FAD-dependent oxidoreductase n=1 Tax=Pararhodobacter sp. TaxID=2127056 RepID=UPI002CB31F58|nr:FAD-dependent oxidoreductase [Pararhodobacter sp.]MCC0073128.1 FAD-dependent oxidoreductase [Rhodobacter sp.]HPD91125.1 FAD-dependent oxidoreductase [Pararhodobacter sp.]